MLGTGDKHHVGERRDHAKKVDDSQGEQEGMKECVDLCTARAWIDKLPLLPESGLTETKA